MYSFWGGGLVIAERIRVLIVEDSEDDALLMTRSLERSGIQLDWRRTETAENLEKLLRQEHWDLVLSDYAVPGFGGRQALSIVRELSPHLPFIVVSGSSSEEEAVEIMRAGADDYVSKGRLGLLPPAVRRALAAAAERAGRRLAEEREKRRLRDLEIINTLSRKIISVLDIDLVAEFGLETLKKRFPQAEIRLFLKEGELLSELGGGPDQKSSTSALPGGEGLRAQTAREQRILRSPDPAGSSELKRVKDPHRLCIPLLVEDETMGVLDFEFKDGDHLDENDEKTLQTISDLIAIALHQSRLYEEAELQLAQRIKIEASLRKSEARYRSFFERDISGDYIATVDGRILDCNPAFLEIFGFETKEQALQTPAAELYSKPEDRESFLDELRRNRSIRDRETDYIHRDGSNLSVIENGVGNFDENGNLISAQGFIVNVTERKRLQDSLSQAQKMESIGRLAGGVAHDFNNILQAMMATAESMRAGLLPQEESLEEDLRDLLRSIRRASRLTKQLLAFSRRQILEFRSIDLNEHIAKTLTMLGRLIDEDLILDFEPSRETLIINADSGQLDQILINLVVNARDATPTGGRITIRCYPWTADDLFSRTRPWVDQADYVVVEVSDSGSGIAEEDLGKIFDPFYTTKEKGKGTGLGLATVYGIVQQHQGAIEVDSTPGEGTTFSIFFPRIQGAAGQNTPSGPNPPLGQNELILFAEDDEMVRSALSRGLRAGGYRVIEAGHGEEAVQLFKEHSDELAIAVLDVVMPRLGGADVRKEIVKIRPDLPILFSSGYSENAIHDRFVLNEGVNLLRKPYSLGELLTEIRVLIDQKG